MSDQDQGREPTPQEEVERINEFLADVDASRARIRAAAIGDLVAGSDAAQDGLARKGAILEHLFGRLPKSRSTGRPHRRRIALEVCIS